MQQRHGSNVLAMELRLPCIKPPKLYVNSSRVWEHIRIRWGCKSEAKQGKQDYFRFLVLQPFLKRYSRWWLPAASVVAVQSMTNTHAASSNEAAIMISSFSKWLLWVIVFTNTAIDIVTASFTPLGASHLHFGFRVLKWIHYSNWTCCFTFTFF